MGVDLTPIILGWPEVSAIADDLARQVRADRVPDVLVGVLRGGMVPAVLLAHALGVRALRAVEVIHTAMDGVDAAKTPQPHTFNTASLGPLAGLDVLIVDDIAGTGDTIALTVELVRAAGAARVRTAICTINATNWRRSQTPLQALTYVGSTVEGWVIFPWEAR